MFGVVVVLVFKRIQCKKDMTSKRERGQFYTVNHDYILDGFEKPTSYRVIEPFAGRGDLMNWVGTPNIEAYDIDPKRDDIIQRDTLMDPPCYKDTFIVTNPPYLARNKCTSKEVYNMYKMNDLYKCFIMSLLNQPGGCLGGIFIVPISFFMSPRDMDVRCRDAFMRTYRIEHVKYFEESVFPDTPTTVVAFSFVKGGGGLTSQDVSWEHQPSGRRKHFTMAKPFRWIIGGDVYDLQVCPGLKISRFVGDRAGLTHLTLCALDSARPIRLDYDKDHLYHGIDTSRTYATLCIQGTTLTEDEQIDLANRFNTFIGNMRTKYWSLFLPQFREGTRKRIPFDLAYRIVSNLLLIQGK